MRPSEPALLAVQLDLEVRIASKQSCIVQHLLALAKEFNVNIPLQVGLWAWKSTKSREMCHHLWAASGKMHDSNTHPCSHIPHKDDVSYRDVKYWPSIGQVNKQHCQQCWLGWLHPSLHWMWPYNPNSGSGPPSKLIADSNLVAKRPGHRGWIGQWFTWWPGTQVWIWWPHPM
jgi:hypothetical protein